MRARSDLLIAGAVYASAVALLAFAASALGVTVIEPPALAAASDVATRLGAAGPLVARLGAASGAVGLPELLAGVSGRLGGTSLLSLRLGAIALSAVVYPVIYAVARPAGAWTALAAAAFALLVPRGLVEASTLGGDGALVALLWAGFLAHLRSRGRPDLSLLAGLLFGLALSVSAAALLALPVLLLHHALTRPAPLALVPRGQFTAPPAAVAFVALAPAAVWLATPSLWSLPGAAIRDALVAAASPRILPGWWAGAEPTPDRIPRFHTVLTLLTALPSATLLLAALGARSRPEGWLRRRPDLALAASVLAVFASWPLVCPPALGRFPGRFAVLLPACALFASEGLRWLHGRLAARLPWTARQRAASLASAALAWPLLACTVGAASLGADASWLSGGLWRARAWGPAPLHDASPLGALAPALSQALPQGGRVYSPEVPYDVWSALHRHGRLAPELRPVGLLDAADVAVLTGDAAAPAGFRRLGAVRRDGQPVVTLYGR